MGKLLSLVLLYEIHTIDRFASVGDLLSYARLVTPKHISDGRPQRCKTDWRAAGVSPLKDGRHSA